MYLITSNTKHNSVCYFLISEQGENKQGWTLNMSFWNEKKKKNRTNKHGNVGGMGKRDNFFLF